MHGEWKGASSPPESGGTALPEGMESSGAALPEGMEIVNVVVPPATKTHHCTICVNKSYHNKRSLWEHIRRSHTWLYKKSIGFSCQVCGKYFKLKSEFTAHLKSEHKDFRGFGCQQCEKSFRVEKSLKIGNPLRIRTYEKVCL